MIESNSRVVGIVPASGLVRLTHIIYLLHGFSVLMGILGPAFIVTTFLTGWPSIIAVIINYAKRNDVRGTYLDRVASLQKDTEGQERCLINEVTLSIEKMLRNLASICCFRSNGFNISWSVRSFDLASSVTSSQSMTR